MKQNSEALLSQYLNSKNGVTLKDIQKQESKELAWHYVSKFSLNSKLLSLFVLPFVLLIVFFSDSNS